MKCNVGKTDQLLRIIGGLIVIIFLGFIYPSWWSIIGVLLVATGAFRFCPLYVPLKINTQKEK